MLQEHSTVIGEVMARDWIAVMLLQGYLAKPHESAIRMAGSDRDSAMHAARMPIRAPDVKCVGAGASLKIAPRWLSWCRRKRQ